MEKENKFNINEVFTNFIISNFDLKLKTTLNKGNIRYLQEKSNEAIKQAKKEVFDDIDRILGQDDWCYIVNKEHYAKIKKKHLKKSNTN